MGFLLENWYLIVAGIAVVALDVYCIYVFTKKPTNDQLQCVREWLLYAVIEAEKVLGSGTGKVKLRFVYNLFVAKFGYLAKFISFDMFSMMVDTALDKMEDMLETNEGVQKYVNGEEK